MQFLADHSDIVVQSDVVLRPNAARAVIRPFLPEDPQDYANPDHPRPQRIADRVLALRESDVQAGLERMITVLAGRPRNVEAYLLHRFDEVNGRCFDRCSASRERRMLIAAYFCAEYSFEAAALFNPSMIPHPEGSSLPNGRTRFLLSLRGVGEGHVSSVTFRTGSWGPESGFEIDTPSKQGIMLRMTETDGEGDNAVTQLVRADDCDISEMVIFPTTPSQRQGIEDMRLVLFDDEDGHPEIYGTYTAFDGHVARSELMHSSDLRNFTFRALKGRPARSKGMALFPRKVGGRYLMLSRQDQESIWVIASDDLYDWSEGHKLLSPAYPWEFIQLGNCGSPIEIDEGWLVLTHGVGVVRSYAIGACLLDKADPSKVIGRMAAPLLRPSPVARDGYVPNAVYSCGGMVHGRTLLLPYGVADSFTCFASVPLDALLAVMDEGQVADPATHPELTPS